MQGEFVARMDSRGHCGVVNRVQTDVQRRSSGGSGGVDASFRSACCGDDYGTVRGRDLSRHQQRRRGSYV